MLKVNAICKIYKSAWLQIVALVADDSDRVSVKTGLTLTGAKLETVSADKPIG